MKNYNFITFEGIEGCGKSTQVKNLQEFFVKNNLDCLATREPGGSEIGNKIRQILLDKNHNLINPKTELLLNFASRIEHIEQKIKPALKQNKKVICDRFFDSTIAYQGYAMGVDLNQIKQIQEIAIGNLVPDITFLIDLPVEIAFERIKSRSENNRYESMNIDFHQKVRHGFLEIAKNNPRFAIIDGSKSREEISNQIISFIS